MTPRERRYFLSLLIQIAIAPFLVHDWDGFVFTRSVRDFLSGMTPYAVVEMDPTYIHVGNTWPPLNTWYAYPPLPLMLMTPALALAFGSAAAPWVVRLALKVPFIAGTMILAWVGARLARKYGVAAADEWERMILLNPFLLFVSAAWGMFDAWMVAFMLLAFVYIEEKRGWLAGAAFGASALIKLFPMFAAPAFMWYVARRLGRGQAARFVIAAIVTFTAISLPFALAHPHGFFLQVIGMHLRRAPQGLSLLALVAESFRYASAQGWLLEAPSVAGLGALTFGLTLGVTVVTTTAFAHAANTRDAVRRLLGLFLGVLFTSKVLNEQYFVIPVALCAFVWSTSRSRWALVGWRACTAGALIASLILGWHVFTFWPPGVADFFFGRRGYVIAGWLASHSHVSAATFGFLPVALSVVALAPAIVVSVRRIARDAYAGARLLAVYLRRHIRALRVRTAHVLSVVIIVPIVLEGAALEASTSKPRAPLDSANRHVGSFYYLWWANPSHDPQIRDGNWNGVSERPRDGYYTISSAKLRQDFHAARTAGIDLMITSFHEYDLPLLPATLNAAYEQDVAVAPLVEIGELFGRPDVSAGDGFALTPTTEKALVEMTSKALAAFATAPAAYRPDGKLAVFFFDSYFAEGKIRDAIKGPLLERAVELTKEDAQATGIPAPSRTEIEASDPKTFERMLNASPHTALWRRAYASLYRDFWRHVRHALEARFGPLVLISGESWNTGAPLHRGSEFAVEGLDVFDASFIYSPSFVWVLHKTSSDERNWERWVVRTVLQAQYARGAGHRVIGTANPTYDDRVLRKRNGFVIPARSARGDTYDLSWQLALDESSDMVLVSTWNEFFEGSGIEPTFDHGTSFLERTPAFAKRLRLARGSKRRGLLLTAEASTHFNATADPDVEGRYAHNLQVVVERDLPDWTFDAIDVDTTHPALSFDAYELVIVVPGFSDTSPVLPHFVDAVTEWTRRGGHLLLSNVAATSPWAKLAGASIVAAPESATRVVTRAGNEIELAGGSRARAPRTPVDAEVTLRYADGADKSEPAFWTRVVGAGRVGASSFDVAGREPYPERNATVAFCACFRALLSANERCGSERDEIP